MVKEKGDFADMPFWFRSQVQDIPIWLLSITITAIIGIVLVLAYSCFYVTKSCWSQRSTLNYIEPLISDVVSEHTMLRKEKKQNFMPSKQEIEDMLAHMLEQRKAGNI
ncbi:uncharacterized protein ACMZJ9_014066 [Mantella aurantiaca]